MANGLKQNISIGQNLKALRKRTGLSQREASAQLEILGIPMIEEETEKYKWIQNQNSCKLGGDYFKILTVP